MRQIADPKNDERQGEEGARPRMQRKGQDREPQVRNGKPAPARRVEQQRQRQEPQSQSDVLAQGNSERVFLRPKGDAKRNY